MWLGGTELVVMAVARLTDECPPGGDGVDDEITRSHPELPTLSKTLTQHLSAAEQEILRWMARGYIEDEDIGRMLFRSPNTVRTQVGSIFRKLGVNSRAALLALLRRGDEAEPSRV